MGGRPGRGGRGPGSLHSQYLQDLGLEGALLPGLLCRNAAFLSLPTACLGP